MIAKVKKQNEHLTKKDFSTVNSLSKKELKKIGFAEWGEKYDGMDLMLIPGKFYNIIPSGFKVVTIGGKTEKFHKGMDNDTRFGVLAYGILVK